MSRGRSIHRGTMYRVWWLFLNQTARVHLRICLWSIEMKTEIIIYRRSHIAQNDKIILIRRYCFSFSWNAFMLWTFISYCSLASLRCLPLSASSHLVEIKIKMNGYCFIGDALMVSALISGRQIIRSSGEDRKSEWKFESLRLMRCRCF